MNHNRNYIIVNRGQRVKLLEDLITNLRLKPLDFFEAELTTYRMTMSDGRVVLIYKAQYAIDNHKFSYLLRVCGVTDAYVLIGNELLNHDFLHPATIREEVQGALLCLQ